MAPCLGLIAGLAFCAPALCAAAEQARPRIPAHANTPKGFCPKGWDMAGKPVFGDLNGDGIKDVIVMFEADASTGDVDEDDDNSRVLVVALGQKAGGFRRSNIHIPIRGQGESGTKEEEPAYSIQRGTILIQQNGGSTGAYGSDASRYRHEGDHWTLIGESADGQDWAQDKKGQIYSDTFLSTTYDYNLVIGREIRTQEVVDQITDGEVTKTHVEKSEHWVLRASPAEGAPPLKRAEALRDWKAYPLRLREPEPQKARKDFSALARGLFQPGQFWLQVRVQDGHVGDEDGIRLLDKADHEIQPAEFSRIPTPTGYVWVARYAGDQFQNGASIPCTIEAVHGARGDDPGMILSTRGSSPGEIRFVEEQSLPRYEDDPE